MRTLVAKRRGFKWARKVAATVAPRIKGKTTPLSMFLRKNCTVQDYINYKQDNILSHEKFFCQHKNKLLE